MAGDGSRCRSTHYACACTLHRLAAADALAKAVEAALDDATLAPHAVEEMLRAALSAYRRASGGLTATPTRSTP